MTGSKLKFLTLLALSFLVILDGRSVEVAERLAEINARAVSNELTLAEAYRRRVAVWASLSQQQLKEELNKNEFREAIRDPMSGIHLEVLDGIYVGYARDESVRDLAQEISDKDFPVEWRLLRLRTLVPDFPALFMTNPRATLPDASGMKMWAESIDSFVGSPDYDNALLDGYSQARFIAALYAKLYPEYAPYLGARDRKAFEVIGNQEASAGIAIIDALTLLEDKIRAHEGYPPFQANKVGIEKLFSDASFPLPESMDLKLFTIRKLLGENPPKDASKLGDDAAESTISEKPVVQEETSKELNSNPATLVGIIIALSIGLAAGTLLIKTRNQKL